MCIKRPSPAVRVRFNLHSTECVCCTRAASLWAPCVWRCFPTGVPRRADEKCNEWNLGREGRHLLPPPSAHCSEQVNRDSHCACASSPVSSSGSHTSSSGAEETPGLRAAEVTCYVGSDSKGLGWDVIKYLQVVGGGNKSVLGRCSPEGVNPKVHCSIGRGSSVALRISSGLVL